MKAKPGKGITAKLKPLFAVEMTQELETIENQAYREMQEYARWKTQNPHLEGFEQFPELDEVCEALVLIRSGLLRCYSMDGNLESGRNLMLVELRTGSPIGFSKL